jgi:hypothetical protein
MVEYNPQPLSIKIKYKLRYNFLEKIYKASKGVRSSEASINEDDAF